MKIIEYKLNNFFRLHSRCHHILSPLLVAAVIAPILATALPSSKVKISGLESIKWKFPKIEMDICRCKYTLRSKFRRFVYEDVEAADRAEER